MTNKDTVNNYQNPANNLLLTKSAFTLAETLIVMGIIGVVAALTLPNLNSSTGDKEKVVKLKKIYSNLQDAFGRVEAVYGPIDEWEWRCDSNSMSECHVYKFVNRMSDFTKVSFPLDYHYLPNGVFGGHNSGRNDTMPVFADGSAMSFSPERGGGGLIGRIVAYVDIDGINKGASKLGSDVFEIIVY
ncbi:type II secretion system protein, partial [bacterium]|nr:type II secretion system protein [bacterium]